MSFDLPPGTAAYRDDRNPEPKNRQMLTLLGLMVGAIALVVALANPVLNLAIDGLLQMIPTTVDQQLGRAVVPIYEAQAQPSPTQDTLNALLDRLEEALPPEDREGRDYQVFYIPDDTVNAAAIPGDRVLIYRGLLAKIDSENALMMILGHELGHLTHRDSMRQLGRSLLWRLAVASVVGDVDGIGAVVVAGSTQVTETSFSQSQEYKADEVGLHLLQRTYGHVAGATDFFETLLALDVPQLEFLSTHPTSRKRIERIERLAKREGYSQGERSPLPAELNLS